MIFPTSTTYFSFKCFVMEKVTGFTPKQTRMKKKPKKNCPSVAVTLDGLD